MACPRFPNCEYTKALWTFKKPYCEKCKGEGVIPVIKNGKVDPHIRIYCECHQDEPEHYHPITPDDIDYNVSYDFHRAMCQFYGWPDPGSCESPRPGSTESPRSEPIPAKVEIPEHRLYKKVQELQGISMNTRMKLQEHLKEDREYGKGKEGYTISDS